MIPIAEPDLRGNELAYVTEAVRTGWISSAGSFVTRLETEFAAYCKTANGLATCNGTAALHLAILAAGVGPGDEVIVPALTFIATANVVRYVGATPVFAEVDPQTWTLDPADARRRISAHTRAIIPVHLYGHPADMDGLREILRGREDVCLIEDAAEAHGARYRGSRVGGLGDLACFSFYGNKLLTTGEGGMTLTRDEEIAGRARKLRDHGMDPSRRYWHDVLGFNYRMTNLQAAVGVAQLERLDEMIARKRQIVELYCSELDGVTSLDLPGEAPWATSVFWLFTVLVRDNARLSRDELILALRERGIDSRPVFFPVHTMPLYATGESFPVSERVGAQGISLPSSTTIEDDQVRHIARTLRELV